LRSVQLSVEELPWQAAVSAGPSVECEKGVVKLRLMRLLAVKRRLKQSARLLSVGSRKTSV
jgi:hypothetical protein